MAFLPPARRRGQHQRPPRFQVPGQGRHHHVRSVARQRVDRRLQRPHPALQLRDQVLLQERAELVPDDRPARATVSMQEILNILEDRRLDDGDVLAGVASSLYFTFPM